MKLLYTDIYNDMSDVLAKQAHDYALKGKRVFYIAPNSLSFEKERRVLSLLPEQASFAITITRFAQMARYFTLNTTVRSTSLDDIGLFMLFQKVLSHFNQEDLPIYGLLKKDPNFIEQLVTLYQEFKSANMSFYELTEIDNLKFKDLIAIFTELEKELQENQFEMLSPITHFSNQVLSGFLDDALKDVVLIIDGFTRFSAEEEFLVQLLEEKTSEIVIGTYASKKAYRLNYSEGNIYQAGVDFLRHLASVFLVKPAYIANESNTFFANLSKTVESYHDFSNTPLTLEVPEESPLTIWEVSHQKEEIEQVAKAIRAKLHAGYRYKDILVLLGDVDSYYLSIKTIFDKYQIPFYLSKPESMSHHPLVHFVDALERLKRYRFQAEDLLNLLKSGLYGQFSQMEIDLFEQYINYADIKGKAAFSRSFTYDNGGQFDLSQLNDIRERVMAPLLTFFNSQSRTAKGLLNNLIKLLTDLELNSHLEKIALSSSQEEAEKHEEVWKTFLHILEQFQTIFKDEKLSQSEFLGFLRTGMLSANYRIVPATLDVVNVKSYDLIEPHTNQFIFAIGLSQSHFPKVSKNTSLLTDEERLIINQTTTKIARFDIASQEMHKKNHLVALSLMNAATKELVLSSPSVINDNQELMSPYLQLLKKIGLPVIEKNKETTAINPDDLGSYSGLLSRLVDFYQDDIQKESFSKEEATFWSVAVRVLKQKLATDGLFLPTPQEDLAVTPLAEETLAVQFPKDKPLQLSASALTDFYENEYKYFLKYVLGLKEPASIHPDASQHGNFLHRIFELFMDDKSSDNFDRKLSLAIEKASLEPIFLSLYQQDAQSQFSKTMLRTIAQATATILKNNPAIEVVAEELVFGNDNQNTLDLGDGRNLNIKGKIDRLDYLSATDSYGVVDYKSSDKKFQLADFYNRLSPQLITYIAALRNTKEFSKMNNIFGAMYLHMKNPIIALDKTKSVDDVLSQSLQELKYKGLFLEDNTQGLNHLYASKRSTFSNEALELMLAYNEKLYKEAAKKILSGHFAINPYTKDNKSVTGEQFKAITRFEANQHLSNARQLKSFPRAEQQKIILEQMKGEIEQ
ncbi:ATP-dependent nuclease subunit B [Streptococcus pacificus]|uniref:ATP-dependent helicase/deoxyribonuclease subunit B n=1 Tax=Streptococcus pacificus TaxID=2740577 RepID=A0ABS0ZHH5_9STRE|nr:ATP-dependent nuclease subunit B [Streptococcus pacificus]MBJ8325447.1 ATP-dependent nuclease subunit B [Streptococcus pacificus]